MNFEMEELVPLVGKLGEKYTSLESTSITYEKAEQLMEAVLYCIHETEFLSCASMTVKGELSAQRAYEIGFAYVEEKTRKALCLYNSILLEFSSYGNVSLHDNFVKDLPEFFKWYDVQFAPQNSIIILDYPVLKDISQYKGIHKIYQFIKCIGLEQRFLKKFPEDYIKKSLYKYNRFYKDMTENICEVMFITIIGHILTKKPFWKQQFEEKDCLKIHQICMETSQENLNKKLEQEIGVLIEQYYQNDRKLFEYLAGSIRGSLALIKNAGDNGNLRQLFSE